MLATDPSLDAIADQLSRQAPHTLMHALQFLVAVAHEPTSTRDALLRIIEEAQDRSVQDLYSDEAQNEICKPVRIGEVRAAASVVGAWPREIARVLADLLQRAASEDIDHRVKTMIHEWVIATDRRHPRKHTF